MHVGICSNIASLRPAVERVFAASALAAEHQIVVKEITDEGDCKLAGEVLLADPGKVAPFLDRVQGLTWMQSTWAGVNALANTSRRDFTCTRLAGCFGPQMSEYVFGAIFSDDWRAYRERQDACEWAPEPFKERRRVDQMTLGCLGVGDIASVIGQRAQAFGMQTTGFASRVRPVAGFHEVTDDLAEVLEKADVIVSVLPSTPQTRGLLDGEVLKHCGSGKLFINVGRGDVVSESSLLGAIEKGWLRGAALDVFVVEPLPPDSALWKHPAVRITPHISAVTFPEDAATLFVRNLELWLKGEPLLYVVDLSRGY